MEHYSNPMQKCQQNGNPTYIHFSPCIRVIALHYAMRNYCNTGPGPIIKKIVNDLNIYVRGGWYSSAFWAEASWIQMRTK